MELSVNDGFGSGSLFSMTDDLRVTSAARSDRYWQIHRALEEEGRITHSPEKCPDHARPLEDSRVDGRPWLVHLTRPASSHARSRPA